jgi:hypothetical protein
MLAKATSPELIPNSTDLSVSEKGGIWNTRRSGGRLKKKVTNVIGTFPPTI